jgi:hypothetical protein
VTITFQTFEENGEMICGLRFMEGRINLPPRALRATLIQELKTIENIAREAGFAEIRHAGDDRGWLLTDYEKVPELRNGRRKRL